ncbi:hypothetical protein VP01_14886g1, partial [Puccinia sorghi]
NCQAPQLRGCVQKCTNQPYHHLELRPQHLLQHPHTTWPPPINNLIKEQASFQSSQARCLTTLKHHQIQALQFLTNNEYLEGNNFDNIWNCRDNNWIREPCEPLNLQPPKVDVAPC